MEKGFCSDEFQKRDYLDRESEDQGEAGGLHLSDVQDKI